MDPQVLDVSLHERRRAQRMQDPEYRQAYERASRELAQTDALIRELDSLRADLGISKAELARRVNRNASSVRRLFTASRVRPELPLIVALADALGAEVRVVPRAAGRNLERVTAAASSVSLPLPRHGRLRSDPCPLAISILDELDAHLRERWNTGSSAAADTREGRATSGGTSRASAEPLPSPRCSNRRYTDAPTPTRHPDRRVSLVRGTVPRRSGHASAEHHPVKLCDAKLDFAEQSKLALQCKVWCSSGAPRRSRCMTTLALTRK